MITFSKESGIRAERPIIFSGDMVRAILEGRKTQTRRLVPVWQYPYQDGKNNWIAVAQRCRRYGFVVTGKTEDECASSLDAYDVCPHGRKGDQLWVRETFCIESTLPYHEQLTHEPQGRPFIRTSDNDGNEYFLIPHYRASEPEPHIVSEEQEDDDDRTRWKPAIHMPRSMSRINLRITNTRIERLQDISDEDAMAEGAQRFDLLPSKSPYGQDARWSMQAPGSVDQCLKTPRMAFANYFCRLYGKSNGGVLDFRPWDSNPWVWVIEFERLEVDQ